MPRRVARAVVALTCAFAVAGPIWAGASAPAQAAVRPRQELLDLINAARERHDIHPVRLGLRASRVARKHSARMARNGRVFSSSSGYPYKQWGENVSCGRSIKAAHEKVMNSQSARQNLLRARYRHVGLGIARSNPRQRACRRATFWVTEVFFR